MRLVFWPHKTLLSSLSFFPWNEYEPREREVREKQNIDHRKASHMHEQIKKAKVVVIADMELSNGGPKSHSQTYFVDKTTSVAAFYNLTVNKPNIKS